MSSKKDKARRPEAEAEKMPEACPEGVVPEGFFPEHADGAAPEATAELSPEVIELQTQLAETQAQAAEYKDGWQRSLADFQNFKRRTDAEKAETYQNAAGNIIRRYLPVLDDIERALAHRPADLAWADGIELIYRKLQAILDAEGVKRIEAEGQPFDPNFHEAVAQEPAEGVESGHVIAVVQNGYMLGERVIRPAQVRVAQ
ncbi:MAG: molecular chaperone GrpE [Anaerolineaceae bacterium]|nr:MAG: molecular chaperone GrpE [Anaerolineaceae bacterium]